ncbi:reverse transcriptase [Corchorus capsularis]|uniref:Reverse transcriptase n=1 Tax=Corchorus capsularis TaxID=210143 RepID=A0A1R3HDS5_COCAP|nr:reverse transcriptase [Corchorus capsularis]
MKFTIKGIQYKLQRLTSGEVSLITDKQAARAPVSNKALYTLLVCTTFPQCFVIDRQPSSVSYLPQDLQALLQQNAKIFDVPTGLPLSRAHDHQIPLKDESQVVKIRPYRYLAVQKDILEKMVAEMKATGIIKDSTSSFASPVVLVKKKDGSWRFCVDYRQLNNLTLKDRFPIPLVEELLDELTGSQWFSKLDLRSGYHQIRMADKDVHKTAFRTHHGHFEFMVMPFGLTNAPSTFQSLMNSIFQPYLRRFIKGYGSIAQPLTALLKKNNFTWTADATVAFTKLKQAMVSAPVLAMPNFEETFVLESDASGTGIGAVLSQGGRPIAYFSRALSPRHQLLSVYEKEMMAILATPGAQLCALSAVHTDLTARIKQSWAQDPTVTKLMQKAKINPSSTAKYTWHQDQSIGNDLRGMLDSLYVRECTTCQQNKSENVASPGLMQPLPIPTKVWIDISMDFISGLPKSHGKDVIMVVVDRLSKYAHFIPLSHPYTAVIVAQAYMDNVYKLHGMPETVVSDRDQVFLSSFWKELFILLGAKLHMSTSYHPQTDGQTEVTNRSLETYLRCFSGEHPSDWVKWLPTAEFWYNTHFHSSAKATPYEILYGQPPPVHMPYIPGESRVDVVDRSLKAREDTIQVLKFHLHRSQHRMKQLADKKRTDRNFEVGDLVYLKLQPYRQISVLRRPNMKLAARFFGPYPVVKKIGEVAYELALPCGSKIHPVFHVSQIKKHIGKAPAHAQLPVLDSHGIIAREPTAILERRMVKRRGRAVTEALVLWSNSFPEDATWECLFDLQKKFPDFDS